MDEPSGTSANDAAARLPAIFESLPCRAYALEITGRVIAQSRASIAALGDLRGQCPPAAGISPADSSCWQANLQRALAGEVVWDQVQVSTPQGVRHFQVVLGPLRNGDAICGAVSVEIDITPQVRTEQSLRESESLYRLLAEISTDLISRHKSTGEWLYASPAARRMLGYEPAELVGRDPFAMIHPEDRERVQDVLVALVLSREPQTETFRIRRKDGTYIWSETVGQVVVDPTTEDLIEVVSMSRDVTDRIEANDRLRAREAELAHAARLSTMGQMATEIVHEMNQPLYAIANFADACLTLVQQPAGQRDANLVRWLELIGQQARRAGNVLRRISQFVRKGDLQAEALQLNDLVREVLGLLDFEIRRQRVEARLELADALPLVAADRILIQQVLVNLLRNAVEAMAGREHGPRQIIVRSNLAPEGVAISVTDTGPGLTEDQFSRAFEPYFTTKNHGTGLGLAICRSAIEAHGGRIWAHSESAGGATFEFLLPISRPAGEYPAKPSIPAGADPLAPR
jgi:PAS domain S-box-containing protein